MNLIRPGAVITFETVTDNAGLAALEADWRALHAAAENSTYFSGFDWMSAAWVCIAEPAGRQLRVVVGRSDGETVLIWPLVIFGKREARMLGSEKFEYRDLLVRDTPHADVWIDAAWHHICDTMAVDQVQLLDIRDDSRLAAFLNRQTFNTLRRPSTRVSIDCRKDGDWDRFFASLSASKRTDHRRQWRRLSEQGDVVFREYTTDEEIDALFDWYFDHKMDWLKTRNNNGTRTGSYGNAEHQKFVRRAAKQAAKTGNLYLGALSLDGRVIGLTQGVMDTRSMHFLRIAYDNAFRKYSPGRLAFMEMVRTTFDRGLEDVDLWVGDAQYKLDFANAQSSKYDYVIACSRRGAVNLSWEQSGIRNALAMKISRARLPTALEWRLDKALKLDLQRVRVQNHIEGLQDPDKAVPPTTVG